MDSVFDELYDLFGEVNSPEELEGMITVFRIPEQNGKERTLKYVLGFHIENCQIQDKKQLFDFVQLSASISPANRELNIRRMVAKTIGANDKFIWIEMSQGLYNPENVQKVDLKSEATVLLNWIKAQNRLKRRNS